MSWLEDYHDREAWDEYQVEYRPVDADYEAWEEYVDEGMVHLANQLSFLHATQEDTDIGEETPWAWENKDEDDVDFDPEDDVGDFCVGCDHPIIGCRC